MKCEALQTLSRKGAELLYKSLTAMLDEKHDPWNDTKGMLPSKPSFTRRTERKRELAWRDEYFNSE